MALPITTGIIRRNVLRREATSLGYLFSVAYEYIVGSKQAKPVDRPLPYLRKTSQATWSGNTAWDLGMGADNIITRATDGSLSYWQTLARNAAYEKLKSELLNSSQLGASLAEYNQAHAMVAARGQQLLRFARALKSHDLASAHAALYLKGSRPKRFRRTKTFGDSFLEYHFGWEPLVKDIYEGLEVCTQPIKTLWAKASKTVPFSFTEVVTPGSHTIKVNGTATSIMQAQLAIENHNMVLANQLGLLNPVAVAWELVPFSFVVDWFSNVGSVINSMSDFAGLAISNSYHTDVLRYTVESSHMQYVDPTWTATAFVNGRCMYMNRDTGIIFPSLVVKPLKTPSITRAATEIALLTQFLGKQK